MYFGRYLFNCSFTSVGVTTSVPHKFESQSCGDYSLISTEVMMASFYIYLCLTDIIIVKINLYLLKEFFQYTQKSQSGVKRRN